jgi:dUTP pyrophosphatase
MRQRGFEPVDDRFKKQPDIPYQKPTRTDPRSAGYDLYSPIEALITPKEKLTIWTDVRSYMLDDEVLEANTRSGNGTKSDIILANTIGWIDSSYYKNIKNDGNIGICLINNGAIGFRIKKGDRIAQVKFSKYLTADDDETLQTERKGGFGHSGN